MSSFESEVQAAEAPAKSPHKRKKLEETEAESLRRRLMEAEAEIDELKTELYKLVNKFKGRATFSSGLRGEWLQAPLHRFIAVR